MTFVASMRRTRRVRASARGVERRPARHLATISCNLVKIPNPSSPSKKKKKKIELAEIGPILSWSRK